MNEDMITGKTNFRDEFRLMLESVNHPYEYCKEVLRKSTLHFQLRTNSRHQARPRIQALLRLVQG